MGAVVHGRVGVGPGLVAEVAAGALSSGGCVPFASDCDDSDDDEESEEDADDEDSETSSTDFQEALATPQAPIVSMETLPITGEARVDDALGRLADLQGLPVHEHVDVFEDVQRRLHETLADLAGQ